MVHVFSAIPQLPADPLFGIKTRLNADSRTTKVDLGIGAYRDDNGQPWVLPSVKEAEKQLQADPKYNHEYLAIQGLADFTGAAARVIFGANSPAIVDKRIVSVQSISGTGSLHIAANFLSKFYAGKTVYFSKPTWANHFQIFESQGLQTATYPYWNPATKSLDLEGYLAAIDAAANGSVFVLHACAHNPTGLDPTREQWLEIIDRINAKQHLVVFDSAYQGFASGDLEKDSWAIRKGVELIKTPIITCQSFAKNVGIYGERVGAFHIILPESDASVNSAVLSQLQKITRSEISNPPAYGAKVVSKILNDEALTAQWHKDMVTMSSRIYSMRVALRDALVQLGTPGNWDHIVQQQGMFSFTGLSPEEVKRLEEKHAVYMVSSGRASVAGLNKNNVEYVARAIDEVVRYTNGAKL